MRSALTATLMAKLRKQAKKAAREGASTYGEEIDRLARARGFPSWRELQGAASPSDLPVDPPLRADFDNTPNENRPQQEVDLWWDRPYALKRSDGHFEVRCLDGGAWDRSTYYGVADTLDEAKALAQRKLKEWRRLSESPVAFYLGNDLAQAVVMPRRPGEEPKALSQTMPFKEISGWLERWRVENPDEGS